MVRLGSCFFCSCFIFVLVVWRCCFFRRFVDVFVRLFFELSLYAVWLMIPSPYIQSNVSATTR